MRLLLMVFMCATAVAAAGGGFYCGYRSSLSAMQHFIVPKGIPVLHVCSLHGKQIKLLAAMISTQLTKTK